MENQAKIIDKSQIHELKFSTRDVLLSKQEAFLRELDLERALKLGNRVKHKVKIFFKANESLNYVETTIWSADSNYISLKGGITIPVTSIYRVQL
jgi:Flp pilus assembly CpaE family ATPase